MSATTPPPAAPAASAATSTEDALGYDAYAKTLWARIEQALNRDAITGKLGDDPLVVGIFGEWGAGKSFLLGRILKHAFKFEQGRIDLRKGGMLGGNAGFGLTVPVLFQPWKYEHEEHLHVPLMLHILEALKRDLAASKSITERAKAGFDDGGDWLVQHMKPAVAVFEKLVAATAVATAPVTAGTSLATIPLMSTVKWLLSKLPSKKPEKPNLPATIRYTNEGRYFYEVHQHLKAVTRPASKENHKKGFTQGQQSQHDKLDINFVVFVDDLDRCLPEKAVAVLELIKTVFNVESFAFVLALDDEVIERGIGHRYKDYSFGNKKSEMPITGFEYLEKIVHLPFRLPALTRDDALLFIKQKELKLRDGMTPEQRTTYGTTLWFSGYEIRRPSSSGEEAMHTLNLSHMLVNSFDAYVPRKLDRAVELFHHVAKVAAERGRPVGVASGAIDIRIVLALVLIQLFQPELFRCLRRTGTGFDQLRDAFKNGRLSSLASDYELLDWACYGPDLRATAADVERLKDTLKADASGTPVEQSETEQMNHAAKFNKAARLPASLSATSETIANLEKSLRHSSQRVRLPIVERMLEHRAAQRHVFDVLKLFAALQASSALLPLSEDSVKPYFSWLALNPLTNTSESLPLIEVVAEQTPTPAPRANDAREVLDQTSVHVISKVGGTSAATKSSDLVSATENRVRLPEIVPIFNALTSFEPREQAELVNRAGLREGQIIGSPWAAELRELTERWLRDNESNSGVGAFGAKRVLLHGLHYLAPYLAPDDAAAFWVLVSDSMALPTKPDDLTQEPKVAALYADVRSALGQDNRFEPTFPVIMTERFASHTAVDEPISGFVRVPPGAFVMGHKTEKTNPPRSVRIYDTFYIARTLTTVAQYALFVKALGYNSDEAIWCGHGLEWMTRNQYLQPRDWPQRLTRQNHPVTSITWFEARAYAQWLSTQLRKTLDSVGLKGYEARLPTDAQWERASRASSLSAAHVWRWPWGDDASNIAQRANIDLTAAPRTITGVGLFAPNQIGLHDMAGNVWEWMDNRADSSGNSDFAAVGRAERYEEIRNQSLSLRGGSWLSPPEYATCAYSGGYLPDKTDRSVGLRIVLSVAQSAKRET